MSTLTKKSVYLLSQLLGVQLHHRRVNCVIVWPFWVEGNWGWDDDYSHVLLLPYCRLLMFASSVKRRRYVYNYYRDKSSLIEVWEYIFWGKSLGSGIREYVSVDI